MVTKNNNLLNKPYILVISLIVTISILTSLYIAAPAFKKKLEDELSRLVIDEITTIVNNTKKIILKKTQNTNIVKALLNNPKLREEIETILSLLVTNNIKYVYIIFKDKDGKFRFLADGSKEEKAIPGQKFDVFNPQWYEIFTTKKDVLIKQSKLKSLWVTYLSPIIQNGEVRAILAVDFSISKLKQINALIDNLRMFIFIFIVLTLGLLGFVIFQFYKYSTLRRKTFIDPLTGVYNRNYLNDISPYIDLSSYAIALIDLDNFKTINDTYGHDVGDIILKTVAERLKETLQDIEHFIIRYGGEEFLIFIRKDSIEPVKILEKLRQAIGNKPIKINENEKLKITVSIGLYEDVDKARSLEQAIKTADIALYKAKKEGKNRLIKYTETIGTGFYSINDIKDALEEDRIICEYQPILNLETGEILHYEALVRILDKKGKLIYPSQFLFEIKGTLLYSQLTQKVLEKNFQILKNNPSIKIAINLSAEDIVNQSILDFLKKISTEDKILVSRVVLEILETEEITNYNLFRDIIKDLKNSGYKIAIDDFGSGYSNFTHLINLNVDYLKIDASLIKNIVKDRLIYQTVKTIHDFSTNIGVTTIAEFISSEEILKKVKEIGIKYGQGFYLAKPMPYHKLKEFEKRRKLAS